MSYNKLQLNLKQDVISYIIKILPIKLKMAIEILILPNNIDNQTQKAKTNKTYKAIVRMVNNNGEADFSNQFI